MATFSIVMLVLKSIEAVIGVVVITYLCCTGDIEKYSHKRYKKHSDEQHIVHEEREIKGDDLASLLDALEPCPAETNCEVKATSTKKESTSAPMEAIEYW